MTLHDFMSNIRQREAFECSPRGCSENDVAFIEAKLQIVLPANYKRFVQEFGYARWFGHCILGFSPGDLDYDTVARTEEMRHVRLPKDFLRIPREGNVIMNYGGGGEYFLFMQGSPREGQVVLFSNDCGGGEAECWPDFEGFLNYFASL